jgi:hypothetical protein
VRACIHEHMRVCLFVCMSLCLDIYMYDWNSITNLVRLRVYNIQTARINIKRDVRICWIYGEQEVFVFPSGSVTLTVCISWRVAIFSSITTVLGRFWSSENVFMYMYTFDQIKEYIVINM